MCGIAGFINKDFKPLENNGIILNMLEAQRHRGSDDSGIVAFNLKDKELSNISLNAEVTIDRRFYGTIGFNRLSIIDLSINGHQPMVSPDERVIIALNGEVYNAFDFRDELEKWGYRFKSTTDTEIVLALYMKYGFEGMCERLNGMFAIVIVDLSLQQLFIIRDRYGIKPMYYLINEKYFAFSSEIKSFGFLDDFKFVLNSSRIDEYLLFRNNVKGTLLCNIEALEPGHAVIFSHENGFVKKSYFSPEEYKRSIQARRSRMFYFEEVTGRIERSVKRHLISDVRLGCQLSGGIDSSLVTWYANMIENKRKLEGISIIFNNNRFDESKYIDFAANRCEIDSHKYILDANYFLENLPKATWHLEAPVNHPNAIAIYKLSQNAKKHVTVLLSGEGADEIFAGYPRFYDLRHPYSVKKLLREIKWGFPFYNTPLDYLNVSLRSVMANALITPPMAKVLKSDFSFMNALTDRLNIYSSLTGSVLDKQIKYELLTYLPDLLIRQDKMSMAHSIENRVPFLDNELVASTFKIPEDMLINRFSVLSRKSPGKYILKSIAAEIFGDEFAFREKMGFGIPLREFFVDKNFFMYLKDGIIPGIRQRRIFNYKIVEKWIDNVSHCSFLELEALWIMVAFEIWATIYLDNENQVSNTSFKKVI